MEAVTDHWDRPDATKVARALAGAGAPFWICAGLAIDLFIGRETRTHHDADVAILRRDQVRFREHLHDWDIRIAVGWHGGEKMVDDWPPGEMVPVYEGALWCRRDRSAPWMFELLLNEAVGENWCFKRNPEIQLSLKAIGGEREGIPFLVPEIVLLHKATSEDYDEGDDQDFAVVVPFMGRGQRQWLRKALSISHPNHPWLPELT